MKNNFSKICIFSFFSLLSIFSNSSPTYAGPDMACATLNADESRMYELSRVGVFSGVVIYKTLHGIGGDLDARRGLERMRGGYLPYEQRRNEESRWNDIVHSVAAASDSSRASKWSSKYGCLYKTPADTFDDIKGQVGSNSAYLREWVENQNQVLEACNNNSPPELKLEQSPNDPPRAVFDRQYQEASYIFYKKDFQGAQNLYEKIYRNKESPHRGLAGYMVARSMAGKGAVAKAYSWISDLAKDPQLSKFRSLYEDYKFILAYQGCAADDTDDQTACAQMNMSHLQFLKDNILELGGVNSGEKNYHDSIAQLDHYLSQFPGDSGAWWFSPAIKDSPRLNAYYSLAQKGDFFDWMQTYYAFNPESFDWTGYMYVGDHGKNITSAALDHAIQRWKAGDGDEWLYLAAARMYPGHPDFNQVRDATLQLFKKYKCADSLNKRTVVEGIWPHLIFMRMADSLPDELVKEIVDSYKDSAFGVLSHQDNALIEHAVRYLLHQKRYDDIKKLGDAFLRERKYNRQLYTVYASFVSSPAEAFTIFSSVMNNNDKEGLLEVSLPLLASLSVPDILDMLGKNVLPENIRTYAARTAFTRAVLLGDKNLFEKAAYQVAKTHPFLKNDIGEMLEASWGDPASRQATAFLLQHPRFNVYATIDNKSEADNGGSGKHALGFDKIDVYNHNDNNWWCKLDPERIQRDADKNLFWSVYWPFNPKYMPRDLRGVMNYSEDPESLKTFMGYAHSDEWIATRELNLLAQKPNGPEYLTSKSIAFAKSEGSYLRRLLAKMGISFSAGSGPAEMLHESVVVTRYGCNRNEGAGRYSKAAFKILHQSYPLSPWTKLTPYWFDHIQPVVGHYRLPRTRKFYDVGN